VILLLELPTINVPQRLVLVNNGDPAVLICEADGIPKPNITWYRDGIEVSN
jgi:Immunoglobulin domain